MVNKMATMTTMAEKPSRDRKKPGAPPPRPYLVLVSNRFVMLTLLSSILLAFAVGRTARILLLDLPQRALLERQLIYLETSEKNNKGKQIRNLPTPILPEGKYVPRTSYTSKNFNTAMASSTNSRWVFAEERPGGSCNNETTGNGVCRNRDKNGDVEGGGYDDDDDEEEEEHMPSGQHLLVDFEHVDSQFLNSEERLAEAMIKLVNQCGLTLLSYHCHQLVPSGVSCVGVLLESHVSFHTWPTQGVITLDLFTCGPDSLLPVVPLFDSLFSIPESSPLPGEEVKTPHAVWAYKPRGFRDDEVIGGYRNNQDLYEIGMVERMVDYKKEIVTIETPFQRVDIWDLILPNLQRLDQYQKSLLNDGSYESEHSELFKPDRLVFLDGVIQSRRLGDAAYHESLVHPVMFAHDNPKRVAIIGGGECATLREVLKHKTVEKVVMIDIDEIMVKTSTKFLPDMSDCSNLEGSAKSCLDDPRAEVYYLDAFAWFTDRFLDEDNDLHEEPFDVIIMDALDPQIEKDFLDALYDEGPFLQSLGKALTPDGLFVSQVGEAPDINTASEVHSQNKNRVRLIRSLVNLGFEFVQAYEEAHCGFHAPWQILVAGRSHKAKQNWYASEAPVNYKMKQRSVGTKDGKPPFKYFDGATMMGFRYPTKATEVVFCRTDPLPEACEDGDGGNVNKQVSPDTFFAFNPALSRRQHSIKLDTSSEDDILEGEKILDNYLSSSGRSLGFWKDEVVRLRPQ